MGKNKHVAPARAWELFARGPTVDRKPPELI